MKPITVRPKQMFAKGREAAADWLTDAGKGRKLPYPLNVCRAVRQFDTVAQYEMMPNFPELLTAWEEGFDSTVAAGLLTGGGVAQVNAVAANYHKHAIEAHAAELHAESLRADILLQASGERLGQLQDADAAAAIDCFVTCAARSVALMRTAADCIAALVEGGAA